MRSWRNNPEGEENQKASRQMDREIFALKMQHKAAVNPDSEEEKEEETHED